MHINLCSLHCKCDYCIEKKKKLFDEFISMAIALIGVGLFALVIKFAL